MAPMEMPLLDPSMCSDCFYDIGTFRFCCDTGRPHAPKFCPDCQADLAGPRPATKFCTASGNAHSDARNAEHTAAELAAEECAFCGYMRSTHTFCTATAWRHSDVAVHYSAVKKRALNSSTSTPTSVKSLPAKTTAPAPSTTATTAQNGAKTTPLGNVLQPSDAKRVKLVPPPGVLAKTPTAPTRHPTREAMFSDGSFLMGGITPNMKILFIGEGNFSFSRTIGKRVFGERSWKNMVATDLELLAGQNVPGHQITAQNTIELLRRGAVVVTGVDAMKISETLPFVQQGLFDLVTFQFPHNADKNFPFYPYPKGLPLESVATHREMLGNFLKQAALLLKEGGRACITTKTSEPYKSWEVDMLAEPPMWFTKGDTFDQAKWFHIGYSHINTVNKCSTSIDGALTYIFTKDSTGCTEFPRP